MKTPGIGRNDPCLCGSGKKLKHCCLGKENSTASGHGAAGISESLLETAPKAKLVDLIVRVAASRPAVRRECLDYLNLHTALSPSRKKQSEGEKLLALWAELAPDLDELDAYGGGDYDADIHVSSLLQEIAQALSRKKIDLDYRQKLLDYALPYIESGNAGLDDDLYDLAYAACNSDDDMRALAQAFETMGGDWKLDHARRIYRRLGDRGKYLELRQRKLATGTDYFDLADFHWKAGEKQKAMEVAETGLAAWMNCVSSLPSVSNPPAIVNATWHYSSIRRSIP
jgi:hypothetical protein